MAVQYSLKLSKLIVNYNLEVVILPESKVDLEIFSIEVGRPGLELAGFYDYFDNQRIQIMGQTEFAYLSCLCEEKFSVCIEKFLSHKPACIIIARGIVIPQKMLDIADQYEVPILRTDLPTSEILSSVISTLNVELAPRITRHGVFIEIYGAGVLILGESGVGKSETAMELVKRGHRLVADDAVEIRRVSTRTLVGTAPENIRHFMELRGIGIINVRNLFGVGAVKVTQQVDLVIKIEPWDSTKMYDRMGMEDETIEILANHVPYLEIPVKPGRNLAIIIEVAAMNQRQRKMGYNSAQDLLTRLGMIDEESDPKPSSYDGW